MSTRYSVSHKHPARTRRLVAVAQHDGIAIPKGMKVASVTWGPAHIKLARLVQQKHRMQNQTGAPTLELRRFLFPKVTKAEKAIRAALSQVGVTEHPLGSNSGSEVSRYIAAAGDHQAEAWCGCFVKWCSDQAGIKLPPGVYWPRARNWADYLPHVPKADWSRGDVVVFRWSSGEFHVAQLEKDGTISTPEGERVTSCDGNRSDRVGIWTTSVNNVFAVVRRPQ